MRRTVLAAAVLALLAGCGGAGESEADPEQSSEPADSEGLFPSPTLSEAEACQTFRSSAEDAVAMREVADQLDAPLGRDFGALADAIEAQGDAQGMDLLDARADARDAAADVDAIC